jgi:hypothetical protein
LDGRVEEKRGEEKKGKERRGEIEALSNIRNEGDAVR